MVTKLDEQIKELNSKIADLRSRLPAHSVKPWMIEELENLEEELERLQKVTWNNSCDRREDDTGV